MSNQLMNPNQRNNQESELNKVRDHFRTCLIDKANHLRLVSAGFQRYSIQLKAWCITLFIASAGFCLKEKDNLGRIFYILPEVPVLLFWFYHAYKEYLRKLYDARNKVDRLDALLAKMYDYSYDELKKEASEVMRITPSWEDQGSFKPKRFFTKKLPGIVSAALGLENLAFFGTMAAFWQFVVWL